MASRVEVLSKARRALANAVEEGGLKETNSAAKRALEACIKAKALVQEKVQMDAERVKRLQELV